MAATIATTYRELYVELDPLNGEYAAISAAYGSTNATARETVLQGISENLDLYPAFVGLGVDKKTYLVHRIAKLPARPGAIAGQWDGAYLATFQDVTATTVHTVQVLPNHFGLHNNVRLPDRALVEEALATGGDLPDELLGPFEAEDANTALARPRSVAYVPPKYVPLFLRRRLTAWDVWMEIIPVIVADGMEDSLEQLMIWARAAVTSSGAGSSVVATELPQPVLDDPDHRVETARERILRMDLPARFRPPRDVNFGAEAVEVLREISTRADVRAAREDQDKTDQRSPAGRWYSNVAMILKFCQKARQEDLPIVWLDLAREAKARADRTILQRHVDERSRAVRIQLMRPQVHSVVHPKLAADICELKWYPASDEAVEDGISLFRMFQGNASEKSALSNMAASYDALAQGSGAMDYENDRKLRAMMKSVGPTDYFALRDGLIAWVNLLEVLFGEEHPLPAALSTNLDFMERNAQFFSTWCATNPSALVSLLFDIHQHTHAWIGDQIESDMYVPPPDYSRMFRDIRYRVYLPPPVPRDYQHWNNARKHIPTQVPTPPVAGTPAPPPSAPAGEKGNDKPKSQLVRNTQPTPGIKFLTNFNVREYIAKKNAEGVELPAFNGVSACLSWVKRGSCYDTCNRAQNHRALSADEAAAVAEYLGESA